MGGEPETDKTEQGQQDSCPPQRHACHQRCHRGDETQKAVRNADREEETATATGFSVIESIEYMRERPAN
ncbi:MAG: hypothetical protein ABEH65_06870 [Halobacteriales archaeon]